MATTVAPNGFFYSLVAPPALSAGDPNKSVVDHIAEFAESASGAKDVFSIGNHVFSALEMHFDPKNPMSASVANTRDVFSAAAVSMSIPQALADAITATRSFSDLTSTLFSSSGNPEKATEIGKAVRRSFLDSVNLSNTLAQLALFAESVKVVAYDAARAMLVEGIYNATALIADGAELLGEFIRMQELNAEQAKLDPSKDWGVISKLGEKKNLAWITIAKDVASLALTVIATVAFVLGVTTGNLGFTPVAMLGLSAFWLAMKLTAHFYNKVVVSAPSDIAGKRAGAPMAS
jgi:hypothetical protein